MRQKILLPVLKLDKLRAKSRCYAEYVRRCNQQFYIGRFQLNLAGVHDRGRHGKMSKHFRRLEDATVCDPIVLPSTDLLVSVHWRIQFTSISAN
ncbi:hypothetical protein WN55_03874 [Dufourea novaeangliae]|uniref:Uncharacterized protein n=1 Tax=Dufourea novaeangliae TaxID=178035 RepID=A0A154NWN5_DUFNO|nr:hypothetical protein WN55_03874 [Dufourea novaeangliae]